MRRERPRKTAACWAVDMRPRRQARGYTLDRLAELVELGDGKRMSSIERSASCTSVPSFLHIAYHLGGLTCELEGVSTLAVIPLPGGCIPQPTSCQTADLRPGEAAWILRAEIEEALEVLGDIQTAVTAGDAAWLSRIVEQASCDVAHSARLLAEAAERMNPTITADAAIRHSAKLMRKGILARTSQPLDAA